MKIQTTIFFALMVTVPFSGCVRAKDKPSEGRCYENSDCKLGEKCSKGWCDDIYHTRGQLKQGV